MVIEMMTPRPFPGWLSIRPRGWVKQDLLLRSKVATGVNSSSECAPSDNAACSPMSTLSEKCASDTSPVRMDVEQPSRDSLSCALGPLIVIPPEDVAQSDASEKHDAASKLENRSCWPTGITKDHGWSTKSGRFCRRASDGSLENSRHRQADKGRSRSRSPRTRISSSCLPSESEPGAATVYVMDAMNILKHRNDEECSFILQWDQLVAAACHYQQRGKKFFIFIRRSVEQGHNASGLARIRAEFGPDSVVLCPAGADDDKFMISFARSRDGGARIVTNDLFRDHWEEVDRRWVQENTIKYAFAAGSFIPEGLNK